jgi:hypothetical protein
MIEQYIFNKITGNTTLQTLLSAGGGKYHVYPNKVPRPIEFEQGITFSRLGGGSGYPKVKSQIIQFSIFARTHAKLGDISEALYDLFDEKNNDSSGGVDVVYSQRQGAENDLESSLDDPNYYMRVVSYYFKLR